MKKRETTKTFSIRADVENVTAFEKIVERNLTNKNKVINDYILEYIVKHTSYYDCITTDINDNVNNLGYKKEFFSREDAEFFIKAENIINSYPEGYLKEEDILRVHCTGVKHSFFNIGLTIYSAWMFSQKKDKTTGDYVLMFGGTSILYTEYEDTVEYMDDLDLTTFCFK